MDAPMRHLEVTLGAVVLSLVGCHPTMSEADTLSGQVRGRVTEAGTGVPIADATILITASGVQVGRIRTFYSELAFPAPDGHYSRVVVDGSGTVTEATITVTAIPADGSGLAEVSVSGIHLILSGGNAPADTAFVDFSLE